MIQKDNFTLQEKIESVMRMLNTPIFRRKIGSEEIIKLIKEICQEMGIKDGIYMKHKDKELLSNNSKINIGTKICLKTNPNVILNIISDDCHGDEFECSNGSVLSLKQIEKYYDII